MFAYYANIRGGEVFNYLTDVFRHVKDVGVIATRLGAYDYVVVEVQGTEERCREIKKKMRRLSRGVPRFTISNQVLTELGNNPFSGLERYTTKC